MRRVLFGAAVTVAFVAGLLTACRDCPDYPALEPFEAEGFTLPEGEHVLEGELWIDAEEAEASYTAVDGSRWRVRWARLHY